MEVCISNEIWASDDKECESVVPLEVEKISFKWNSYYELDQGFKNVETIYNNGKILMKEMLNLTSPALKEREAVPRDFSLKVTLP